MQGNFGKVVDSDHKVRSTRFQDTMPDDTVQRSTVCFSEDELLLKNVSQRKTHFDQAVYKISLALATNVVICMVTKKGTARLVLWRPNQAFI